MPMLESIPLKAHRAVDAIKDAVHRTYRNEVVGDIGGWRLSIAAAEADGRSAVCFWY